MEKSIVTHKFLQDVEDGKKFYAWNGTIIKNLSELCESLKNMDKLTYSHHSNQDRNDFYNWVKEVIGDDHLANLIKMASTHEETTSIVEDRVAELKKFDAIKKSISILQNNIPANNLLAFSPLKEDDVIRKKYNLKPSKIKKPIILKNKDTKQSKIIKTKAGSTERYKRPIKLRTTNMDIKSTYSYNPDLVLKQSNSATNQKNTNNKLHEHMIHSYTNKHLLLGGVKDFLIGLFIGWITAIILLAFIKF